MKLSVIICTKNRPESFKKTQDSLNKQTFRDWELVVVTESPLSKARDLGWRRAKGEIVSYIDDDVLLDKNWTKNLVAIFDKYKDVAGVSGPTIIPEQLLKNRLVFWWYKQQNIFAKLWIWLMLDNHPERVGKITKIGWWSPGSNFSSCLKNKGLIDVDFLEACNMSLRRNLIKQVGGYDLKFKGTSEWCEPDLAMRVKKLGFKLVWSHKVKLKHLVSQDGVYIERRRLPERIQNYLRFRRKHL
jgi:glycosyltransferase involved in cell wall biosynthesis